MDLTYFENLWQTIHGPHSDKEAYWDGRADFFNARMHTDDRRDSRERLVDRLTRHGILQPGHSVLDIGCGAGKHALAFARTAAQVVGTDISARALSFAAENAAEAGLANISFVKGDWEQLSLAEHQWENRFDLVFAAMCPGIGSKAALEKMIQASRGYCLISLFASREDSLRGQLAAHCGLAGQGPHHGGAAVSSVYCIFNLLWLLGYYPEIRLEEVCWQQEFSPEEALRHYSAMLAAPDSLSAGQQSKLEEYLARQVRDGKISESVKARIAWIGWYATKRGETK